MSKYHKIRWTDSDEKELKRVVKNFNAKISRLKKKDPQTYNEKTLPTFWNKENEEFTNKVSVGQLKDLINTRQDLKRELNALKRFSKRGSEQIVQVTTNYDTINLTKWQRTEMKRRVNFINKRREHRLDLIMNTEVTSRGKKLGYTRGEFGMGKIELKSLEPIQAFNPSTERYNIKERWRSILNQSQHDYFDASDYRLRENFIKGMMENYNPADITDVVKSIREMDIDKFLEIYYQDPNAFEWDYPPNEEEYQGYLEHLKSTWTPNTK